MTTIDATVWQGKWVGAPLVRATVTSEFGEPRNNRVGYHTAVDLVSETGTPREVRAIERGELEWVGVWDGRDRMNGGTGGYGNVILLTHPDGDRTLYAHLAEFHPAIQAYINRGFREKPRINKGDILGIEGNTGYVLSNGMLPPDGNLEHGRHLHFEFRDRSGFYVNPKSRLSAQKIDAPISPAPIRSPVLLQAMAVASLARAVHEDAGIAGSRVVADLADKLVEALEEA